MAALPTIPSLQVLSITTAAAEIAAAGVDITAVEGRCSDLEVLVGDGTGLAVDLTTDIASLKLMVGEYVAPPGRPLDMASLFGTPALINGTDELYEILARIDSRVTALEGA